MDTLEQILSANVGNLYNKLSYSSGWNRPSLEHVCFSPSLKLGTHFSSSSPGLETLLLGYSKVRIWATACIFCSSRPYADGSGLASVEQLLWYWYRKSLKLTSLAWLARRQSAISSTILAIQVVWLLQFRYSLNLHAMHA